jgi:hypothetical protein
VKKLVAENLNEYWEATSTTDSNLGTSYTDSNQTERIQSMPTEKSADFSSMIPPKTIKLSPEEFENYVSQLIEFIPQSPVMALQIFKTTLDFHPYLTKKPVGFNRTNPYQPSIAKFVTAFRLITKE